MNDKGEDSELNIIEEGNIFGEISVFIGVKRSASARAVEDSILARSDMYSLNALVKNNPDFALQLFQTLSSRIYQSERNLMQNISTLNKEAFEKQRIFDSLAFLLLIVLGQKVDIHGSGMDLIDIRGIIADIDDDISIELAKIILMKRNYTDESEFDFNKRVREAFEQFYKKTISPAKD